MGYGYPTDPEVEQSTNRVMQWGLWLMLAMVVAFPLYRVLEPSAREDARIEQKQSLAEEGQQVFAFNCAACHGDNGQGIDAPALNSKQFLTTVTDDQARLLVSVGIPGTAMSAYSQDFGGPLTSEQIRSVVTFLRSLEPNAPDRPDWRSFLDQAPADAHGDEGDAHGEGG